MRIIIVGAGIGGLTAAALLQRDGHEVEILERSSAFGEVGAGIQVSPNASRVLHHLGLTSALAEVATTPERIVMRRWEDDCVLLERPLGDLPAKRYGAPYLNLYRPDLIDLLAPAVTDVPVSFNTEVRSAASHDGGAHVETGANEMVDADIVLGADGIHSAVRTSTFGHQPTRFSQWVAYRALVPRSAVEHLPIEVTNRLGPMAHLVSYFIGADQRLMNLVCVVHEPDWDIESWTVPGELAHLRNHFAAWSPELNAILDAITEPVFKWALHDRTPLQSWTAGNVALLGDACHPMVPFMAQGAAQAIEDAAVLARCLRGVDGSGAAAALATYEATRLPRASKMQARSFDNATTYHYEDGDEQQQRDEFFAALQSKAGDGLDSFDGIYGHDPLTTPLAAASAQ